MKIKIGNKIFEVTKEQLDGNPEELVLGEELIIRSAEEETSFIENHKKDARKEGIEIAVKKARETFGLEFQGKTVENLLEHYKSKVLADAQIEPTEQLKKVNATLAEKEAALNRALERASGLESEFKSFKQQSDIDRDIDALLPEGIILPKDDMKALLKMKIKFDKDENGRTVVLDAAGNIVKSSTTADAVPVKDILDSFFRDNPSYMKGVNGGNGGKDSTLGGGAKITVEEFTKQMAEKGVAFNSEPYTAELTKLVEANLIEL